MTIEPKSETPAFPIVGVGASAGGLEAYQHLLRALPADTGMAFVLVQHLAPEHQSMLAEILGRSTAMPVIEVHDEPRVEPNHVYVIPPNRTMLMTDGHLKLVPRSEVRGQHRSIDTFLRSLADEQSHHAVGVILSGTGNDGTLGLEAVKAEGGITFAQDESAQQTGMPRSAAAAGCVDFVLPPDRIAAELARIGRHPYVAPGDAPENDASTDALAQSELNKVLQLLHDATGVDFILYKSTTLYRRITRRMLLHRLDGLPEYYHLLREDAGELQALYRDILISVTAFFRDPACFDVIKSKVLPQLLDNRGRRDPLRIWTLGCSTGEEAYSLAMTVAEYAADHGGDVPTQIYATDLNDQGIDHARAGVYTKNITQDVSPERLRRFFVETEGGYQVAKSIREMCVFARQNVMADPPFSRMDLISCRNLLIYMEPALQKRLVPILHYALKPGGFLWLGTSESVGGHGDLFEPAESKCKVFARKPGQSPARVPPLTAPTWTPREFARPQRPAVEGLGTDVQREADRVVVARYAPPGVLVSAELEVLQFRGDTSPYLAQAPGKPSMNVLKMAREGLLVGLRAALQKALKDGTAIRHEGLRVKSNGGYREIDLEVLPVRGGAAAERSFLVLFEDPGKVVKQPAREPSPEPPADAREAEQQVAHLTQELAATREHMQSLVEQQEAANEELQSANEEIQSANEELQSLNEELQTSKEEIQSTNEELTTVNDELRHRNEQLARTHDDLNNFVASSNLAMVVVSTDLRIRRFTPAAEKLLNLIAGDVGRPIGDLKPLLGISDLETRLTEVIDTARPLEREVQDRRGHWYSLRKRPYRTLDNKIDGAVLVLVDIEEQKRTQDELRASQEKYRLLVEGAEGVAIVLLDDAGRVTGWNLGAERLFGYVEAEIMGQHFTRFFLPEDVAAGRSEQELRVALDDKVSYDDIWLVRKDGSRFYASGTTTALRDDGKHRGFAKLVRDTTDRKLQEEALRESQARLQAALSAGRMGTWIWYFEQDRHLLDESLCHLLGLPPGEARGLEDFLEAIHPGDRDRVREAFERSARDGAELDVEFRVARTNGDVLWIRDRGQISPATNGFARCLIGACVDATALKAAEQALQETDRRKNEFLATLAHELRNPLAPLSNSLEVLRRSGPDIAAVEQGRAMMERQVRKLTRLVDDLLDVSRLSRGSIILRWQAVDLVAVAAQAVESVQHHFDAEGHVLSASLPSGPVWVHGDPVRLEQAVANLLHNAAKYTKPGGRIALSLDVAGWEAVLRVQDSGIGLAPENLLRVFDFFVRSDDSYTRDKGGLGVGLALVKSLVEMHGGTVEASSSGADQGSEFVIRLPVRSEPPAEERTKSKSFETAPTPRRVLVVDDNVDAAQSEAVLLRMSGHEVHVAHSGPDALEAAAAFRPEVVLLDIGMPGMDGYEAARQLRRLPGLEAVKLVALSGYGTDEDRHRSAAAGFDAHLVKPADPVALTKFLAVDGPPSG
ncbi:MAG TPA: chemotaxis protein CheB [Fimbriiglobus sp.]|nr:chemotaxis protein CheB [Fimbriiglobus sp.]